MLFDEARYKRECEDWKNYWTWHDNRNDKRWFDERGEERRYDAKNMSHCIRLLYSCLNIARTGRPLVWLEGEIRDKVMSIKTGAPPYEEIYALAGSLFADIEREFPLREFRPKVDEKAVRDLLYQVRFF
jgi:hypothetical protein